MGGNLSSYEVDYCELSMVDRVLADTTDVNFHNYIDSHDFTFLGGLLQIMGVLILLSILLYFLLFFFKRLNTRLKNKNEDNSFKIHDNIYISQKQGLSAITFGKKLYIIGFSINSISVIDIIEDEEIIAKLNTEKVLEGKFHSILSSFFKKEENTVGGNNV
jgi:flagellar biogenesis protein FliO